MKKFYYVYLTTNIVNGKQYIGDRSCNINPKDDLYLGSGRPYFLNAVRKYGKENFKKEILEFFDTKQEAFNAQEKYINKYNTLVPNGYNISPTGGLLVKGCHSDETKKKISKSNKGKIYSDEYKLKISIACKGIKRTNKTKSLIRTSLLGHIVSDETKEKISNSHKNKPKFWLQNKQRTEETKLKISQTKKDNPYVYTDEVRLKMSLAKKGKIPWNKGKKIKTNQ